MLACEKKIGERGQKTTGTSNTPGEGFEKFLWHPSNNILDFVWIFSDSHTRIPQVAETSHCLKKIPDREGVGEKERTAKAGTGDQVRERGITFSTTTTAKRNSAPFVRLDLSLPLSPSHKHTHSLSLSLFLSLSLSLFLTLSPSLSLCPCHEEKSGQPSLERACGRKRT